MITAFPFVHFRHSWRPVFLAAMVAGALAGCASVRMKSDLEFNNLPVEVKKIAILPPDMKVYDISGGGIWEYRDDWSTAGKITAAGALQRVLGEKGFESTVVPDSMVDSVIRDLTLDLDHHCSMIGRYYFGPGNFIPVTEGLEYSVGPIKDLCQRFGADGFVFVSGVEQSFSPQRMKVLQEEANLRTARSSCFAVLSLLLVGSATFRTYSPPPEIAYVSCIVVTAGGRVAWYRHAVNSESIDFRKPYDVVSVLQNLLSGLGRDR